MEKKTLFSEQTVKIGPDSGYDNYIMAGLFQKLQQENTLMQ